MQTFLISPNPIDTAKILDDKRLFKQIVEGNQIANCLLVKETRWKNHPAVRMWKGYEFFLVNKYIDAMIYQWAIIKKHKAEKSIITHNFHKFIIKDYELQEPFWFSEEFFLTHKSNLIRKNPNYYRPIFGYNIPDNLSYIWDKR
ncbi:MAG: MSMEG_6728 family protein [Ignavibacteriae bacterium]|nr:MSMEG_6728 family protein [Ignavibacteriota bacterium]